METSGPNGETLVQIYEIAETIRYSDERFRKLLTAGKIAIHYYSARGQEIIPASLATHLNADDYVVTTYRGLHDQIAKGVPLKELFAEYLGRAAGTCKGKGGPMHVTYPKVGLMVTTGIVGSGLPIANGLALASTIRQEKRVTVVNFGDGASNIGAFHEALNLAALWQLPVVFVCQNNLYAERTAFELGTSVGAIADRAVAYGMAGITVDGNDPPQMWRAAKDAVERARSGDGPTLLEARTFRFFGHSFGDQDLYMPKEEKAAAIARDPIPLLRRHLLSEEVIATADIDALEERVRGLVDAAMEFALESEYPELSDGMVDVYD